MKRWEYLIVRLGLFESVEEREKQLDRRGNEGWELAGFCIIGDNIEYTFKIEKL